MVDPTPEQWRAAYEAVGRCLNPDPNDQDAVAPVRSTEFYMTVVDAVVEALDL